MTHAEWFRWLLESTCASSAAIVLVLLLRRPLRAASGANAAYLLWALPPLAVLAASLPAPVVRVVVHEVAGAVGVGNVAAAEPLAATGSTQAWLLLSAWIAGVAVLALRQVAAQRRFRRSLGTVRMGEDGHLRAQASAGLPAVVGLRARIVLPADFEDRYSDDERALILDHERIHLARRDVLGNALVAALCSAYWFNPLAWIAADRFRRDQELACDESVVARNPHARRAYGEAMVKTQLSAMPAPLACHWFGGHPLKERIAMLKRPVLGSRRVSIGLAVAAVVVAGAAIAVWAMRPATRVVAGGDAQSVPQLTMSLDKMPVRETAIKVAEEAGLRLLNPEALPERPLMSLTLEDVDARTALQLVADEAGLEPSFSGKTVQFVLPADADAGPGARDTQADASASLDVRSKELAPPRYPAGAAAEKVTGKVVVIVDVAADGSVADARVEKSEPVGVFEDVTLEAVKKWKFEPALKDGKPVAGRVRVPVNFDMDAPEGVRTPKTANDA